MAPFALKSLTDCAERAEGRGIVEAVRIAAVAGEGVCVLVKLALPVDQTWWLVSMVLWHHVALVHPVLRLGMVQMNISDLLVDKA